MGQLVRRLDARPDTTGPKWRRAVSDDQRRALGALLSAVWRVIRNLADFWDGLDPKQQARLRAFFAETKGDPRRIAAADPKERAAVVAILREGLTGVLRRAAD